MNYWTESSWTVFASSAKESLQFKQKLPFALIGSGPHCHVRLPVQEDLRTVYLACNFDDRIEIWPLCATAFPAWGIIPPVVEVLVGQYRLRFEKNSISSDQRVIGGGPPDKSLLNSASFAAGDVELTMSWGEKSVKKVIARSVTILGSHHPSVWRTRGRKMRPCDHALVCERGRVWLIDLNPKQRRLENPAIHELLKNGEYYQVGDMRLSRGTATVECEASVRGTRERQSHVGCACIDQPAGVKSTSVAEKQPAVMSVMSLMHRHLALTRQSSCETSIGPTSAQRSPSNTHGVLEGLDCPEMLTSRLTGRLVSINHSRFTRVKSIRMAASAVTFVAASIFLIWLFR